MDGSDIDKIPSGSFSDSVIELFAKEITKSKTGNVKPPKSMIASLMKKVHKIALDNRHAHSRIAKYTL